MCSYVSKSHIGWNKKKLMSLNVKLGPLPVFLSFLIRLILNFVFKAHHISRWPKILPTNDSRALIVVKGCETDVKPEVSGVTLGFGFPWFIMWMFSSYGVYGCCLTKLGDSGPMIPVDNWDMCTMKGEFIKCSYAIIVTHQIKHEKIMGLNIMVGSHLLA